MALRPWHVMLLLLVALIVALVWALVERSRSASTSPATLVVEPGRAGKPDGVTSADERSSGGSRRGVLTVAAEIAGIVSAIIAIVALLVSR